MKKVICIALCCVFAASLVAVPVFASSVPETTAAPNVFDNLFSEPSGPYTCTVSDYSAIRTFFENNDVTDTESTWISVSSCTLVKGGVSSDGYTSIGIYNSTNCGLRKPGSVNFFSDSDTFTLTFTVSDISYLDTSGLVFVGSGGSGLVPELADEVFYVGGGLISFVMSNWIVLIPVVAFLVILCIGVIRKSVKGA